MNWAKFFQRVVKKKRKKEELRTAEVVVDRAGEAEAARSEHVEDVTVVRG